MTIAAQLLRWTVDDFPATRHLRKKDAENGSCSFHRSPNSPQSTRVCFSFALTFPSFASAQMKVPIMELFSNCSLTPPPNLTASTAGASFFKSVYLRWSPDGLAMFVASWLSQLFIDPMISVVLSESSNFSGDEAEFNVFFFSLLFSSGELYNFSSCSSCCAQDWPLFMV